MLLADDGNNRVYDSYDPGLPRSRVRVLVLVLVVVVGSEGPATFRLQYEDDYEYEFSVLSTRFKDVGAKIFLQ